MAVATVSIPNGIRTLNGQPVESKYFNLVGTPYTDTAEVLSEVTSGIRHIGQTFNVDGIEYWFNNGILDVNLEIKQSADVITNALYDAFSVIIANSDNTPEPLVINTNSVLGRIAGNIQSVLIDNDLSTVSGSDDTLASAKAIKSYIDSAVTGTLTYQGGYNASTNTPNLDVSPSSLIRTGWTYTVTVAGTFFSTQVEVGDMIISEVDSPTLESDWTIVSKQIDQATTTVVGIIRIATATDYTNNDNTTAVSPSLLKSILGTTSSLTLSRKYTELLTTSSTQYTITHGLNTQDVVVSVRDVETPFSEVEVQVTIPNTSSVVLDFTLAPNANKYKVTIVG